MKIRHFLFALLSLMVSLLPGTIAATGLAATPSASQEEMAADSLSDTDELVAYSDTSAVSQQAASTDAADDAADSSDSGVSNRHSVTKALDGLFADEVAALVFVLLVLFIVFVVSPVMILLVILYFVHKNRKSRMRLAEEAMKNGQPLSNDMLPQRPETADELWQKGVRQLSLGLGLILLLGLSAGKIGVGVGLLVSFIGLGNIIIAKKNRVKSEE